MCVFDLFLDSFIAWIVYIYLLMSNQIFVCVYIVQSSNCIV